MAKRKMRNPKVNLPGVLPGPSKGNLLMTIVGFIGAAITAGVVYRVVGSRFPATGKVAQLAVALGSAGVALAGTSAALRATRKSGDTARAYVSGGKWYFGTLAALGAAGLVLGGGIGGLRKQSGIGSGGVWPHTGPNSSMRVQSNQAAAKSVPDMEAGRIQSLGRGGERGILDGRGGVRVHTQRSGVPT
ncbi:MAG: hypothetical protein Q8R28_01260 [Dehalococcoidia bacterium]|nr:hypothetical protein [Dehalococcoidia bacterium]